MNKKDLKRKNYTTPLCISYTTHSVSIMDVSVTQGNHFGDEEEW